MPPLLPLRRASGTLAVLGLLVATAAVPAQTVVKTEGESWTIASGPLSVRVEPSSGRLAVTDAEAGHTWVMPEGEGRRLRDVVATADGITATADLWTKGKPLAVKLAISLPSGSRDLTLTAEADPATPVDSVVFLPPFVLETPTASLAVANYSNGHLYELDRDPFPARWLSGDRIDLPFVGLCDLEKGFGYALILETPEDAVIESKPHELADGRSRPAPQLLWQASRGTFAYPRKIRYRFAPSGGYVALAKAYRAYAKDLGLLVTLEEKARKNPNVARLFGATDIWGGSSDFPQKAREAGLDRLLVHGRQGPDHLKAANDLGFLTAEYDNYTDIQPLDDKHPKVDSNHDRIPEHVVLKADGERMKAWLTYDSKTQFMKRCPALWVESAKAVVPDVLAKWPFLGRFIDVTTAEALYECHDPAHPLSKPDKRRQGEELLSYVRSLNLVVGGEHGIWWAVPQTDYFEGMMSHNGSFAWPAGHLIWPASKDETYTGPYKPPATWEGYDRDGIGHASRIPLWELVFHDCVVTTWYWGDSSDFLVHVDPSNQDRKDAFNILYGTMPMLWAGRKGTWDSHRERFLRTCKEVGAVTRVTAPAEMLSHEFVTPDRAVQRTRFSNGVEVVVNFGPAPYEAQVGGRTRVLPQYGYVAHGPGLDVSRETGSH